MRLGVYDSSRRLESTKNTKILDQKGFVDFVDLRVFVIDRCEEL